MFELPRSTEFYKRIPKQKFYENLTITPALKRAFIDQIQTIVWCSKIAETTINLAAGSVVTEIEVFEIRLNSPILDERVMCQIDKEIPYHILFILNYQERVQAWIGYKEAALSGKGAFKVNAYYHTDWMMPDDLPLSITGLTLDEAYENFVRQVAGDKLKTLADVGGNGETLKESIEKSKQREKLERQIAVLESKIRKEPQFNKQVEMNGELKVLKKDFQKF